MKNQTYFFIRLVLIGNVIDLLQGVLKNPLKIFRKDWMLFSKTVFEYKNNRYPRHLNKEISILSHIVKNGNFCLHLNRPVTFLLYSLEE